MQGLLLITTPYVITSAASTIAGPAIPILIGGPWPMMVRSPAIRIFICRSVAIVICRSAVSYLGLYEYFLAWARLNFLAHVFLSHDF